MSLAYGVKSSVGAMQICMMETDLGWIGTVESKAGLVALRVGYLDKDSMEESLAAFGAPMTAKSTVLARRLRAFSNGTKDTFLDIELDFAAAAMYPWTPFRRAVTRACRAIPVGKTLSYSELARVAGRAGASRAVGSVMARNPWPIVVPCHRVVRSDGSVGGFSVPHGSLFKERILTLEGSL